MWTYFGDDGSHLASVKRDDAPPIGYPVRMCGPEMGPVRNYIVTSVNEPSRILTLKKV